MTAATYQYVDLPDASVVTTRALPCTAAAETGSSAPPTATSIFWSSCAGPAWIPKRYG